MNSKTAGEGIPSASGLLRFKGVRLRFFLVFSCSLIFLPGLIHPSNGRLQ
jgi:hypothetical protein